MEDSPLVTIVIPTYKRNQFLSEAIESALGQYWPNVQVIVVSDGDPGARSVVCKYNVLYVERCINGNQSAALNTGLKYARGKYLIVQHDDDISYPFRIATTVPYMEENPDCGFVHALSNTIDANGETWESWDKQRKDRYRKSGLEGGPGIVSQKYVSCAAGETLTYRTEAIRDIGGWRTGLPHGEEFDFHMRLTYNGWRSHFEDSVVSAYRIHGGNKSLMQDGKLVTLASRVNIFLRREFRDAIRIAVSSIPSRLNGLEETCRRLRSQRDEMFVALAGHESPPAFLDTMKIKYALIDKREDRGTKEKFRFLDGFQGYYITCDDDVLYPMDYVETLVRWIHRYDFKAIIGFHGSIINRFPVKNYYKNRDCIHFAQNAPRNMGVHVLGNVCGGFHTDTLQLSIDDFGSEHTQDDIWLSIAAQKQGVPIVVPKHAEGWIRSNPAIDQNVSIFGMYYDGNKEITDSINALGKWRIHQAEPRRPEFR